MNAKGNPVFKRKFANLLQQPSVQTRLGWYCVLLSFVFAGIIATVIYINLGQLFAFVIEVTDSPDDVADLIIHSVSKIQLWIYLTLVVYISLVLYLSIWYTHRLVGPMVAFNKHFEALKAGDFTHRTYLRKNDAFHDSAQTLNEATAVLEQRYSSNNITSISS